MRTTIIVFGCAVTILSLVTTLISIFFPPEEDPSGWAQAIVLFYMFFGFPINLAALLAHIKWKQKLPIKVTTLLLNFLPVAILISLFGRGGILVLIFIILFAVAGFVRSIKKSASTAESKGN